MLAVLVHGDGPAEDVRPVVLDVLHLPAEFAGAGRIAEAALHHLDEAAPVCLAAGEHVDFGAVVEDHVALERRRDPPEPRILLRSRAVALGVLLRVKPHGGDELAVPGAPGGRPQPAGRARSEIPRPLVQGLVYALRVGHLSTQYLDEHDLSLPRRRVRARHRREWYSPDVTRGARRSRRNRR